MRYNFKFFGIRAALRKNLSKNFIKNAKKSGFIDWEFLEIAMACEYREINYLAIDILKAQRKHLSLDDFDRLVKLASIRSWWG